MSSASSLTGKDFVAWNGRSFGMPFTGVRARFGSLKAAKAFIDAPVVEEYTELVEALTRLYGRIGMHEVCGRCFRGEKRGPDDDSRFMHYEAGTGCCKPCGLQGREGCLSKPLGCALWMCQYTKKRFQSTYRFIDEVQHSLIREGLGWNVLGFFNEKRPRTLSASQRHLLRVARHAIDGWQA